MYFRRHTRNARRNGPRRRPIADDDRCTIHIFACGFTICLPTKSCPAPRLNVTTSNGCIILLCFAVLLLWLSPTCQAYTVAFALRCPQTQFCKGEPFCTRHLVNSRLLHSDALSGCHGPYTCTRRPTVLICCRPSMHSYHQTHTPPVPRRGVCVRSPWPGV